MILPASQIFRAKPASLVVGGAMNLATGSRCAWAKIPAVRFPEIPLGTENRGTEAHATAGTAAT